MLLVCAGQAVRGEGAERVVGEGAERVVGEGAEQRDSGAIARLIDLAERATGELEGSVAVRWRDEPSPQRERMEAGTMRADFLWRAAACAAGAGEAGRVGEAERLLEAADAAFLAAGHPWPGSYRGRLERVKALAAMGREEELAELLDLKRHEEANWSPSQAYIVAVEGSLMRPGVGGRAEAERLADKLDEFFARSMADPRFADRRYQGNERPWVRYLLPLAARMGEWERGERLAMGLDMVEHRVPAMLELAFAAACTDPEAARRLIERAVADANAHRSKVRLDVRYRPWMMADLAGAYVAMGEEERGLALLAPMDDAEVRVPRGWHTHVGLRLVTAYASLPPSRRPSADRVTRDLDPIRRRMGDAVETLLAGQRETQAEAREARQTFYWEQFEEVARVGGLVGDAEATRAWAASLGDPWFTATAALAAAEGVVERRRRRDDARDAAE